MTPPDVDKTLLAKRLAISSLVDRGTVVRRVYEGDRLFVAFREKGFYPSDTLATQLLGDLDATCLDTESPGSLLTSATRITFDPNVHGLIDGT